MGRKERRREQRIVEMALITAIINLVAALISVLAALIDRLTR